MEKTRLIINNRNRLTSTRCMVEDFLEYGWAGRITVLDNGSTYRPLMEWYATLPKDLVEVVRLTNLGPRALWDSGYMDRIPSGEWIAYTDSDIVLPEGFNSESLSNMVDACNRSGYSKLGFALRIDDLPDNAMTRRVREWESQFWKEIDRVLLSLVPRAKTCEAKIWKADVDTTFAVFRAGTPFTYSAYRVSGEMWTARHAPWYVDFADPGEEEMYYIRNSSDDSTHRRYYRDWVAQQPESDRWALMNHLESQGS